MVLKADREAGPTPTLVVVRGARAVAKGAHAASARDRFTRPPW
ncbi:hypothetical protein GCM10009863_37460 [Streptomyces axinellae]|uniref:Uncharacterized protein n=1 Tax=Streptomyces axinellae TaxID=552788 RepID=A0ABP6CKC0_9ACTN